MTRQQRDALDSLLRSAPRPPAGAPEPTPQEQRLGFAQALTRPAPDGVATAVTTLAGRPALDLEPAGAAPQGRILYLHGGGYVVGSPATHAGLAGELALRTGVRATSPDYRLAPEHPFPAAVDDGLAAYRALLDRGEEPRHLALAGDSAGGGLALATLLAARQAGLPLPAAAVLFSPWTDLTVSGTSARTKEGIDPIFVRADLLGYAGRYLAGADATHAWASPLLADLTGLPPLLVQAGSRELLLDDAVRLAARAGSDDVDVTLQVWAQVPHVFQNHYGRLDEADAALDEAARFLADRLAVARPAAAVARGGTDARTGPTLTRI